MSYLENYFDKRMDPTLLVPGAKSVVSLLYNYSPKKDLAREGEYKVSKYAYGEDYHFVVKDKLKTLLDILQDKIGTMNGRAFVDSAPVMERSLGATKRTRLDRQKQPIAKSRNGQFLFYCRDHH